MPKAPAVNVKTKSPVAVSHKPASLTPSSALGLVNPLGGFVASLAQKTFLSALVKRKISFAKKISVPKPKIPVSPKLPSIPKILSVPKKPSATSLTVPNTTINLHLTQISSPAASASAGGFFSTLMADIQNFLTSLGL